MPGREVGKRKIEMLGAQEYFDRLKINLVYADVAIMKYSEVYKKLQCRESLLAEVEFNLRIQEAALKDFLILSLARLFEKSKRGKSDQISILNIQKVRDIHVTEGQIMRIRSITSDEAVKSVLKIRDTIVAHTLSHAKEVSLDVAELKRTIDLTYDLITELYADNFSHQRLRRMPLDPYAMTWSRMTADW